MTYNERNIILNNENFIGKCRIALTDWVEYWAVNGTSAIEDQTLREQTDTFIRVCLENPDAYVWKIAHLVISEPSVKDAVEVTDANVAQAVTNIMSHALSYIM